jgi:hypothetical protein
MERPRPRVDATKLLEYPVGFGRSVGVTGLLGAHLRI